MPGFDGQSVKIGRLFTLKGLDFSRTQVVPGRSVRPVRLRGGSRRTLGILVPVVLARLDRQEGVEAVRLLLEESWPGKSAISRQGMNRQSLADRWRSTVGRSPWLQAQPFRLGRQIEISGDVMVLRGNRSVICRGVGTPCDCSFARSFASVFAIEEIEREARSAAKIHSVAYRVG